MVTARQFTELPFDILEPIFGYLTSEADRYNARRAFPCLQSVIDSTKIHVGRYWFAMNDRSAYFDIDSVVVKEFKSWGYDCTVPRGINMTRESYNQLCIAKEFQFVMRQPKLELEELDIHYEHVKHEHRETCTRYFKNALKTIKHQIQVKEVCFETQNLDPVMTVLPSLKPGFLEKIEIEEYYKTLDSDFMRELVQTEQWKQAQRVILRGACCEMIQMEHFWHFKEFRVKVDNLTKEHMEQIRDILLTSPHLEIAEFQIKNYTYPSPRTLMTSVFPEVDFELTDRGWWCSYGVPGPHGLYYFTLKDESIEIRKHGIEIRRQGIRIWN